MGALQLEKRRPTAATSEEWPVGMRVRAVDDDRVCLKILEVTLKMYNYNVTTATNAKEALQMLREKKGWYELVITDLHMPEMDGIELLQLIRLEMDLPVIFLSANDDRETVMKGVRYGACEYMVKPIRDEQIKHIWQHVLRRNPEARNQNRVQGRIPEDEQGAKSTRKNSRNKKNDGHHSLESKENDSTNKPRVSWSVELHGQSVDAVNRIGIDKAGPKKISDMMNVDHVSRGSVASHLQKYKRRLSKDPKSKPDNNDGLCHEAEIRKMSNMELSEHSHEDRICRRPSSVVASSSSNNQFTSQQPIQPLDMGTVSPGGIMPNYPSASASAGATGYGSYPKTLSDMLLEANQRTASSHLGNPSARIPSSGQLFRPLNQFPVQPAAPVNHSSALNMMNAPATNLAAPLGVGDTSMFPGLVGNYNNTWQTLVPFQFPDLLRGDGTYAGPSQANVSNINQLASSCQIPMIQNEMQNLMAASNSNTSSSVVGFNQQMSPFSNLARNTSSFGMLNGNFAPAGSISSTSFPNLPTSNSISFPSLAPAGSTSGISFPSLAHGSTSGISFPNIQTSNPVSFPNLAPAGSTSGISFPNLPTGSSVTPTQQMFNGLSMSFPDLQTSTSVTPTQQMFNGVSMNFSYLQTSTSVTPTQQMFNGLSMSFPDLQRSTSVTPTQMVNGARISCTLSNIQPGNHITLDQIANGLNNSYAPPNIEADSSIVPTQMLNGKDAVPNIQTGNYITLDQIPSGLRNSSTPPNIEAGSSVAPAQMLDGGDAVGILPAQEGIADLQALDSFLNNDEDFSLDGIDVDMLEYQNLSIDDVLFNKDWTL